MSKKLTKHRAARNVVTAGSNALTLGLKKIFDQAVARHRNERFAEAEALYRKILTSRPDHPETIHLLGVLTSQTGDNAKAIEMIREAIALNPGSPDYHTNLGNIYKTDWQLDEAVACYKKALELLPDDPPTLSNLGVVYNLQDKFDEALECFRRVLQLLPDEHSHYNLGLGLMDQDNFAQALTHFNIALKKDPGYFDALLQKGKTLRELDQYDESLAILDQALILRPQSANVYLQKGITYKELGRHDLAHVNFDEAEKRLPDFLQLYFQRGLCFAQEGKFDAARKEYQKMAATNPDLAGLHFAMTSITKFTEPDQNIIRSITEQLEKAETSRQDKILGYFALGKIYDDSKMYDEAFVNYHKGNQLRMKTISFKQRDFKKFIDRRLEFFNTTDTLKKLQAYGSDSQFPVFIVGMPRSGTTLTEQIIASHPQVHGAGELTKLGRLLTTKLSKGGLEQLMVDGIDRLQGSNLTKIANEYEAFIRQDIDSAIVRITDKMPYNFIHLGFIAMMFPKARIVHCRRNPMDTCVSNYFQRFATGNEHSFDLGNIGFYYCQYERLMEHWRKVLPIEIYETSYEDLTSDPEPNIRRMIEFCGLPWDDACLTSHKSTKSVKTASIWQARQPIYKSSSQRWKRYEKDLGPLKEALHWDDRPEAKE